MTYRTKLLHAFVIYGLLLISCALLFIYKINEVNIKSNNIEKAHETFLGRLADFEQTSSDIEQKLIAVDAADAFKRYLHDSSHVAAARELFFNITNATSNIMQLRYIDNGGRERIRIDRDEIGGAPHTVGGDDLQDKSNRYYFRDVMAQDVSIIWYSNLDLNIEHGEIEEPHKPVIRLAKSVFVDGQKTGILIINVFMNSFLESLSASSLYHIYLVDKNGNFLLHPDDRYSWVKYLNGNYDVEAHFGEDAYCILNNDECYSERLYSNRIGLDNEEGLRIIIEPKLYTLHAQLQEQFSVLLYVLIGILSFSLPLAYLFSKTPGRLKEEVDALNLNLKKEVEEKVAECREMNKVLGEQIYERTMELGRANTKLYKLATTDYLTNIPSHNYFLEIGERYLQLSHRKKMPLSLMVLDIDNFKHVNEKYGHRVGDVLLVQFTKTIFSHLRKSDIFGRVGGEEFTILLNDADLKTAMNFAEDIRQRVENTTYLCEQHEIKITVSIGLSQARETEVDLTAVFARADQAISLAKGNGRNRIKSFMNP